MAETTLPILLSIRRKLPELSGNFRNIAEQILKSPESVLNERVSDLAKRSRCDSAQVIRLCQKFGFDGFSSLKNRIMEDFLKQRRTLESQIPAKGNSFDQLKQKFADEFIRTVNDTLNEVDEAQVGAAAGIRIVGKSDHRRSVFRVRFFGACRARSSNQIAASRIHRAFSG